MMNRRQMLLSATALATLTACAKAASPDDQPIETNTEEQTPEIKLPANFGNLESFDPAFNELVSADAKLEVIGSGFKWTEGPAWDKKRGHLYFSDIPNNKILTWDSKNGISEFLVPAGADHGIDDAYMAKGTNGIWYNSDDTILICNQNARSIDRMNLETGEREMLVRSIDGKAFNSPNDAVQAKDGTIFFTDPPYGQKDGYDSKGLELDQKGVYQLSPNGDVTTLADDMLGPNGIGLSPDETHLYVSQSFDGAAIVRRFTRQEDGSYAVSEESWIDLGNYADENNPGYPDGMAIDDKGNLFVTSAGGVAVISPDGKVLGRIITGKATANCAFGEDGSTLFITSHDLLLKINTNTLAAHWA